MMFEVSLTKEELNQIIDALQAYSIHFDSLLTEADNLLDVESIDEDFANSLVAYYRSKREQCFKLAKKLYKVR